MPAALPMSAMHRGEERASPSARRFLKPVPDRIPQLTPMARTFFPNLKRLAAVADADAGASFSAAGLQPVIDDDPVPSVPLAAAVLSELGVEQARIEGWAARQRQRAAGQPPEALAVVA
jgi:hypothetical protein